MNLGRYDEARQDIERAVEIAPTWAACFVARANLHCWNRDYYKAIPDFDTALRLNPQDPNTHFLRGCAQQQRGEADKATADYTEAIRLDPRLTAAYYNRACNLWVKGDYDKAIADCTKAIQLDPKWALPYAARACVYRTKGEDPKADEDSALATKLGFEGSPDVMKNPPAPSELEKRNAR